MPRPLLYILGTFCGTGFAPIAPATVASFAVTVLWFLAWIWLGPIPIWLNAVLICVVTLVGVPVASRLERIHGQDPSLVVIDEVAGMLVTFLGVSTGAVGWLLAFFWFRFFDIFKPLGIRRLEKLDGGLGIMADDLGAGVLACICTHVSLRLLWWWA